jgi:diadenosine tetraphosphate (Ap4A) HIT family hydrolase
MMNHNDVGDCLVCRKHIGEIDIPGGVIYQNDLIFVSHAQLWGDEKEHYLGHIFIESKRHVPQLADLTEQEAQAIGLYSSRVAKALLHTESMEHVYSFFIGDGVPHVHIHVIGRYPNAPKEYWATKVDDWPEAPKGTAKEIEQVAARVQNFLVENFDDLEVVKE